MKKRKTPICKNTAAYFSELRDQQRALMRMAEQGEMRSEACKKYPPCVLCKREGDLVRKCFFPLDCFEHLKAFGYTFALSICPDCFDKLLTEDCVYQIVNLKEIGILLKK